MPDVIFPLIAIINIILVFLLLASVFTVVHAGEWPDWRHYTQFLTLYSDGFGFWQPKVSDPWLPVLFISVLGLCWGIDQCLIRNREIYPKKQSSLVMMVGALGIAQFTYFVYRPHPFNLYHIMWPSIIILYWYIDYLVAQQAVMHFQKYSILLFVTFCIFMVIMKNTIIILNNVAAHTGLGWVVRQSIGFDEIAMPWGSPPISASTDASGELHRLFDEFPASQSRIPMIVDVDILDAGLLQTRKINWFPISYEEQDGLIPLTKELMSQAGSKLEVGAMLIIERGLPRRRPATYGAAFDAICSRGSVVEVLQLQRMSLARFELAPPYGSTDLCREGFVGAL